jgi:hypothetical protein
MPRAIDERCDALERRIEVMEMQTARLRPAGQRYGHFAALLALPMIACASPQDGAIRDVRVRADVSAERTDVAVGARVCAEGLCLDVRTYYLREEGAHVVCVELPGLMARPHCEVLP